MKDEMKDAVTYAKQRPGFQLRGRRAKDGGRRPRKKEVGIRRSVERTAGRKGGRRNEETKSCLLGALQDGDAEISASVEPRPQRSYRHFTRSTVDGQFHSKAKFPFSLPRRNSATESTIHDPPIGSELAQVPLWGSSLGNDDRASASTLRPHGSTNVMPGFCLSERSSSRKSGQRLIRLRPEFVVLE